MGTLSALQNSEVNCQSQIILDWYHHLASTGQMNVQRSWSLGELSLLFYSKDNSKYRYFSSERWSMPQHKMRKKLRNKVFVQVGNLLTKFQSGNEETTKNMHRNSSSLGKSSVKIGRYVLTLSKKGVSRIANHKNY